MAFNAQDPKWTAYVLGEIDDDARSEIETELAASPEAQRFVDDLRRTIDLLSAELAAEPCPALSDDEAVEVAALDDGSESYVEPPRAIRPEGHGPAGGRLVFIALAASLLAAVGIGGFLLSGGGQIRQAIVALKSKHGGHGNSAHVKSDDATELEGDDASIVGPQDDVADADAVSFDIYKRTQREALAAKRPRQSGRGGQGEFAADSSKAGQPWYQTDDVNYEVESPELLITESHAWHDRRQDANRGSGVAGEKAAPGQGSGGKEKPRKDIAYTVVKPTYESKSKDITYNGKPTYETGADGQAVGADSGEGRQNKSRLDSKLVEQYNTLMEERRYPEAEVLAKRAVETDPSNPLAKQMQWNSKFVRRTQQAKDAETSKEQGVIDAFADVDRAAIPFDADRPLEYPNKETWDELSARRKKWREFDANSYEPVTDNPFLLVTDNPLSTFSIDVDTGSYSIVRRYLQQNHQLPPPSAVRIEELVNYFHYDYPQPEGDKPFAANVEVAGCPWNGEHRLVRVGIKGREMSRDHRPLTNLVFLVDVSGSMQSPDKLPLVKESLRLLAQQMGENDRVAIVVYAGSSGLVLPSTQGTDKPAIMRALDALAAGGSTNGAQGIQLAYDIAVANFIKGGVNRVILATDGDFNVGVTDRGELTKLIEQKAASGVFLTTLGYGMGNLKDATLEQLADKGNGNYAYIDNQAEAKKVLVEQMSGTLVTIAKDVKIQIEFNPNQVASFRLIGYENRILRHEDFNNDKKDAGDIGAGHTVTALYELVPAGKQPAAEGAAAPAEVDPLKYQKKTALTDAAQTAELLTLKLRYKQPDGDKSQLLEYPVKDSGHGYGQATGDFKFAASVALFGMLLRDSPYKGTASFDAAVELAQEGRGSDPEGYRSELIELINAARTLKSGHEGGEGVEIRE